MTTVFVRPLFLWRRPILFLLNSSSNGEEGALVPNLVPVFKGQLSFLNSSLPVVLECWCSINISKALSHPLLENDAEDKQLMLRGFLLSTLSYPSLKINRASLTQGNYLKQLTKMSPAYTHKHSKGWRLLIFILVFTSFSIMPGCPFFYRKWCLKYCYLWTTSLPSPLTASFLPSLTSHTLYASLNLWPMGNESPLLRGWARPTERLQRKKDRSTSKKCFSSSREKCGCGLSWLLGKRSNQAPPWTPDTQPQHNKGNAKERPYHSPPPFLPILASLWELL